MLRLLFIVGLASLAGGCGEGELNLDKVKAPPGFMMSNNLVGTVTKSAGKKVGEQLTFVGLNTSAPQVIFGEGGMTSPLTKVFESEATVTFILVASGSGGVDAFVIDKHDGKFARASAGSLAGVYASASVGMFK